MAMMPLPLRIEPALRERLAELAKVEGRPVSGLARDLLRQAVDARLEFFYRKKTCDNQVEREADEG